MGKALTGKSVAFTGGFMVMAAFHITTVRADYVGGLFLAGVGILFTIFAALADN